MEHNQLSSQEDSEVMPAPDITVFDADGNFVAQAGGALDAAALQKGIDMLLE